MKSFEDGDLTKRSQDEVSWNVFKKSRIYILDVEVIMKWMRKNESYSSKTKSGI